jgi:hypothetical protein
MIVLVSDVIYEFDWRQPDLYIHMHPMYYQMRNELSGIAF